jgi:hypothetical protein
MMPSPSPFKGVIPVKIHYPVIGQFIISSKFCQSTQPRNPPAPAKKSTGTCPLIARLGRNST